MEGSNFWPRKGEPSVSQPFFSISCTFCKEATGSRQAWVEPTPLPVPLALPATLDEGTGSSHRCQGCMPTQRIEESCGAQQQHPSALGDSSSDVQGRTTTSVLHPPSSAQERADGTQGGEGATGNKKQLLGRAEPRPMWVHPRVEAAGRRRGWLQREAHGCGAQQRCRGVRAHRHLPRCREGEDGAGKRQGLAEPHAPKMEMWGGRCVRRSSEIEQSHRAAPRRALLLEMGRTEEPEGMWQRRVASTYQLMALGLALQLLVVVEGEAVQHGMLLLIHCGHGALLVDLVDVDLLLTLQDGVPPVLVPFVQVDLGTRCKSEESGERSPRPAPGMCYPPPHLPPRGSDAVSSAVPVHRSAELLGLAHERKSHLPPIEPQVPPPWLAERAKPLSLPPLAGQRLCTIPPWPFTAPAQDSGLDGTAEILDHVAARGQDGCPPQGPWPQAMPAWGRIAETQYGAQRAVPARLQPPRSQEGGDLSDEEALAW